MAKCEILLTTKDGQKVAGAITFSSGVMMAVPIKGHEVLMDNVWAASHEVDGKEVSREDDAEVWFKSLPSHYNGSYLRARMVSK
jgi:hypothetical protein